MNKKNCFIKNSLKIFKLKIATIGLFVLVAIFSCAVLPVLALETGLEYGTITGLGTQDIRISIMNIVRIFLGLLGIIAIIIVMYGGYIWMTSGGSPEKIDKAKKILTNAAIGLLIILLAFAIVSFIINALSDALGIGQPGGPAPPPGCENCGYLGGGIIESVFPPPLSIDNPRDTSIIVTFKEEVNPETIISGLNAGVICNSTDGNPCKGNLAVSGSTPNIRIYKRAGGEFESPNVFNGLAASEVTVVSEDMKTYTFFPKAPLGDSLTRHYYTTKLTGDLTKDRDDRSAFPGVANFFSWDYEIGTRLDLVPPQVQSIYPPQDNIADIYSSVAGDQATSAINVNKQPSIDQPSDAWLITQCNDGIDNDGDGGMDTADSDCDTALDITPEAANDISSIVSLTGSYNGVFGGELELRVESDQLVVQNWDPDDSADDDKYSVDDIFNIISVAQRVDFGNGLSVVFQEEGMANALNQVFSLGFEPESTADTLQISSQVYRFIAEGITSVGNEINITGTPGSVSNLSILTQNITDKIETEIQDPNVLAIRIGTLVNLTAELVGQAGNFVNIATTGSWAEITPMSGGTSQSTATIPKDKRDNPRNSIISIQFDDAMLPTEVAGKVVTDDSNIFLGVGGLDLEDFNNIMVQADLNKNGIFEDNEYVSGKFIQSNQYRTVEFISLEKCKDEFGNNIINSCGLPVFCLPINPIENYVKYRVTIKAASLRTCDPSESECVGLLYEDGTITDQCLSTPQGATASGSPTPVCGNSDGIFYLKTDALSIDGVIDKSLNSFDGNKNRYTQGPQAQSLAQAYSLNAYSLDNDYEKICDDESGVNSGDECVDSSSCGAGTCRLAGDDLVWEFYVNNKIDLDPPIIINVTPDVGGIGASLISPINSTYNKLLRSSTVKPDSGYIDGTCTCVEESDCTANDSDQVCISGRCINQDNEQTFCGEDNECSTNDCRIKKYISLYDSTVRKGAWWISNTGEDIKMCLNDETLYKECSINDNCDPNGLCGLQDDNYDRTLAQINHTPFLEATNYSAEIASGVQDIFQNCYMPSEGPEITSCRPWDSSPNGCCEVTAEGADPKPYCCNGVSSFDPCVF